MLMKRMDGLKRLEEEYVKKYLDAMTLIATELASAVETHMKERERDWELRFDDDSDQNRRTEEQSVPMDISE